MPEPLLKRKSGRLSSRSFLARNRSLSALVDMRHGALISQAAHDNRVSQRTIKRYVGSALIQDRPGGRIRATKSDRLVRYLQIPSPVGPIDITDHGSKEATAAAKYKAAVNRFLGGDLKALAPWHGKKIAGVELVTDGPRATTSRARLTLKMLMRSCRGCLKNEFILCDWWSCSGGATRHELSCEPLRR